MNSDGRRRGYAVPSSYLSMAGRHAVLNIIILCALICRKVYVGVMLLMLVVRTAVDCCLVRMLLCETLMLNVSSMRSYHLDV